jgi:hypothetical protein
MNISKETLARFEHLLLIPGALRWRKKFLREEKSVETRREILDGSLRRLPPGTELDRAYEILEAAKNAEVTSYLDGVIIDQRRKFRAEQKKYRSLMRQLNALREKWGPGISPLKDSLKVGEWDGPTRRARPGHQKEPWLSEARQEFAALKVPRDVVEDLFVAVGLTQDRNEDRSDIEPPTVRPRM